MCWAQRKRMMLPFERKPAEPSMAGAQWEWEALAVAAIEACLAGDMDAAAHLWQRGDAVASGFASGDPRCAAAANNAGVALFIRDDLTAAASALQQSVVAWEASQSWIERMAVPVAARSSLFHLRMEQRHRAAYEAFKRHSIHKLLEGAAAMTLFNMALVSFMRDEDGAADALLAQSITQRRACCGASDPALGIMLALQAGRHEGCGRLAEAQTTSAEARRIAQSPARDGLALWRAERPRQNTDVRAALAAGYLTAIADPQLRL
jgi:hypothetical protein